MSVFHLETGEFVLFVGEGNFSFCHSLVKCMKKSDKPNYFTNLYVTCLEEEQDSIISQETKSYLKHSGAKLIFAVDATKLSKHSLLGKLRFNKILFNFPHVGGKMKIHLNRQLLQDFFLESSSLLATEGEIIVTLCAGQGGTPADVIKRRWDDTWQIVEMAARSGLVLKDTKLFPNELLGTYISVGYRGKMKSFNTNNAIIHYFRMGLPLVMNVNDELNKNRMWHLYDGVLMSYAHKKKLTSNPLQKPSSPQSHVIKILEDLCSTIESENLITCDVPLYTKFPRYSDQAHCIVAGEICYLRKNLLHIGSESNCGKHYIIKGLSFNKFSVDFTKAPAECHVAVFGPRRHAICQAFISKMQNLFYSYILSKNGENEKILTVNDWFQLKDNIQNGIDFNIDQILECIFSVSWRQLWASDVIIKAEGIYPLLVSPSIYFQTFTFDISFMPRNVPLDIKTVLILVHQMNCDLIESSRLLKIYEPKDLKYRTIYCFRFVYKSYSSALCKKNALAYHNLLGKTIEQLMHVEIV